MSKPLLSLTLTLRRRMNIFKLCLLSRFVSPSQLYVPPLINIETNDNKGLEQQAFKAVRLIAEHRKSQFLSSWIESGFTNETAMDPAEGYQALQISNREIDDEMIMLQYNMAIEENPGSVEFYNKALAAIATGRGSSVLLDHLHSRAPQVPGGTLEEPVGLENIGNTCYLNSLLQFLFTMTKLRHIVLNFDDYKMPLDEESMERKRVGQRKVSLKEVQTAQRCKFPVASCTVTSDMRSCGKPRHALSWHDPNTTNLYQTGPGASTTDTGDRKCQGKDAPQINSKVF
jgi:hypothetical protein